MKLIIKNINNYKNEDSFAEAFEKLDESRKITVSKMKNEGAKLLSLAAGAALVEGMEHFGISFDDVAVEIGKHGKPRFVRIDDKKNAAAGAVLEGEGLPYFNLSHSGEIAVAAFGDRELGVDVEQVKERKISSVIKKLSPGEREYVLGGCTSTDSVPEEAIRRFMEVWTLKESYLKCKGMGLTVELDSFEVIPAGASFEKEIGGETFEFTQHEPVEGYIVAICERVT